MDNNYTFASVLPYTEKVDPKDLKPEMVTKVNDDTGQPEGTLSQSDLNKNFGKATLYQTPRQVRFGIKYTF